MKKGDKIRRIDKTGLTYIMLFKSIAYDGTEILFVDKFRLPEVELRYGVDRSFPIKIRKDEIKLWEVVN